MSQEFVVKLLKLVTGEELIAKVQTSDAGFTVQKPVRLTAVPDQSHRVHIVNEPYSYLANLNEDIWIPGAAVVAVLTPNEQAATQYLASIAGISVPGAGGPPQNADSRIRLVE